MERLVIEQEEEPPSNVKRITVFLHRFYSRFFGCEVHQMYLPGHGFTGCKYGYADIDLERICLGRNSHK